MEKCLLKYQRSTQGVDGIFWVYFRYYSPPVCCSCWCPFSVSLAPPATRTPLAQKGAGIATIPTTKFPLWPRTAGAKGSWFPSPHVDAPRPQGMARPTLSPGGGLAPSPALQLSPSEYGQEPWNLPCPAALGFGQVSLSAGWRALQGHPLWVTSEFITLLQKCQNQL